MIRSRRRRTALLAVGALVAAGLVAAPTSPAQAQTGCRVDYQTNDWTSGQGQGGFTAQVTITNLGPAISSWNLTFTFPAGQRIDHGWSARWSQSGSQVTASNEGWNGNLGTGASTTIGFNGSWTGSNPAPTDFALNGVACNGQQPPANQPPTVSITSPADGAEFTAPADVTVTASASDPDGSVVRVEFYRNGSLVGSDTTAPYSYTHTSLPAGEYVLLARAVDDDGATSDDSVTVTVGASTEPTVLTTVTTVNFTEGNTGSFGVRLSHQPSGNVTVTTTRSSGSTAITVDSGATLTFTPQNWSTPQEVVLWAPEGAAGESAQFTVSAPGHVPATVTANVQSGGDGDSVWVDRFFEQYDKIKNSGYFSPENVPYHAVETMIVEAPDHGHETTSEAFSFWLWLEATYGRLTGDWQPFNTAWNVMETYIIPDQQLQPTNANYNPNDPATYAPEFNDVRSYPSPLDFNVPVGQDPIADELRQAYGSPNVYGMHWLMDVDNVYGFGRCGDGQPGPAMINTYQRGPEESVFETIPHPSCERFNWGGPNGFLDLFIDDEQYAQQWRFTNAPDADARAVQAAYWALVWAKEQGNESQISGAVANAAKMGDWLRYAFFDKYFKRVGNCVGPNQCPAGTGKDSAHYLLSWYYAWGGGIGADWAFRIGSSHTHQGYQNPMAAWVLAGNVPELRPQSQTGASDWQQSLDRQLEYFQWLQSPEGAIAGGATNSWDGQYGTPPPGTPTFYGMFYDEDPVFHDPPSNQWFGFQVWSMQRVAEYLYVTGDARAQAILDKWVPWAISHTTIGPNGDYEVPSEMRWSGAPDTWNPNNPGSNSNLSVQVVSYTQDVGVTSGLARTLMWYAAATNDTVAQDTARQLIEALYANSDPIGIAVEETRADFDRLNQEVYVPQGYRGTMPNGDVIEPGATFDSIRSFYHNDPDWPQVQAYIDGTGPAPTFRLHRFWAQADIAMAFADYALLFE